MRFRHIFCAISVVFTLLLLPGIAVFAVDLQTNKDTKMIEVDYYNPTNTEQTIYVAGLVDKSIKSVDAASALEITSITDQYPLRFSPDNGLIDDSAVVAKSVDVSKATFVDASNQLRIIYTPGLNGCQVSTDVKGCNWDIGSKNKWNPQDFSCLTLSSGKCGGAQFNQQNTTQLPPNTGGRLTITIKTKDSYKDTSYQYFPASLGVYMPTIQSDIALISTTKSYVTTGTAGVVASITNSSSSQSLSSINSTASTSFSSSTSNSSLVTSKGSSISTSSIVTRSNATTLPTTGGGVQGVAIIAVLGIGVFAGFIIAMRSEKQKDIQIKTH